MKQEIDVGNEDTWNPKGGVDLHSRVTPPPQYLLEDTEFEKEIKSRNDFTLVTCVIM